MDFSLTISTPMNTTEANPLCTPLKLTEGRLCAAHLYFPPGPAGKLHFIATFGIHQIIPFNTGESIALDDCVLPLSLGFDLIEPPFLLTCKTWNTSTLYDHTLFITVTLDPFPDHKWDIDTLMDLYLYGRNPGLPKKRRGSYTRDDPSTRW